MQELSPYLSHRENPGVAPFSPDGRWSLGAEEIDFRNYWRVLRKHLRLIAAATLAALMLCGAYLAVTPPIYTATSTILFQPMAPAVYDLRENLRELLEQMPGESDEHDYYKTQYEILRSQSLALAVIRDLHLQRNEFFGRSPTAGLSDWLAGWWGQPAQSEGAQTQAAGDSGAQLIGPYLAGLAIKPRPGTTLATISFSSPDPELSARIVNAHIRAYVRQGVELRNQANKSAGQYMEQKLAELKERVEKSEAALNQYRRERGIPSFSVSETGGTLMQRLTELNTDLTKAATARITLETQHQLIAKGEYESLPAVSGNPVVQNLKEETAQLAAQYASMSNRFNPGYHRLDDLRAKLDQSQRRIEEESRQVAKGIDAQYRAAFAAEAKLRSEIESVKAQASTLNDASLQDAILKREVDTNSQLYKNVLQRMNELGMSTDVPASAVTIVDRAKPPGAPSSPKVRLSLLLSLFLGLFAGVGLAFALERFDNRLKSTAEVRRFLHVPTLGVVPDFATVGQTGYARRSYVSRRATVPEIEAGTDGGAGREVVVTRRTSVAGEAYRAVRTALLFSRAGNPPKVILVTSSVLGEGKTVTALNLATSFAQLRGRSLLIDADLRRPRCHRALRVENEVGLADVLVGRVALQDAIRPTDIPELFVLTAGASAPSPLELLGSDQMRELLATVSEQFDFVLVDSPPVIPVSDAVTLSTMVDGVVLVVDTHTPKQAARETRDRFEYVGAKVIGAVLNKLDVTSPDYNYYHGYSYRYSYDDYYQRANNTESRTS